MDLHEVWERNKRWILSVLAGAIVFWIGLGFVRSMYDVNAVNRQVTGQKKRVSGEDLYNDRALEDAEAERDKLRARNDELREALAFVPDERFLIEGKGDPDLHWSQVSRDVARSLRRRADDLNIELDANGLRIPAPEGQAEIERALLGIHLMQVVGDRLMESGDTVRLQEPENLGLVRIERLAMVGSGSKARNTRGGRFGSGRYERGRGGSSRNRAPASVDDLVRKIEIDLQFEADAQTVWLFLESCRALTPRVTVESFSVKPGSLPTDPQDVTAKLSALIFRDS